MNEIITVPDTVLIRRTCYGWSAFSGDALTGLFGDDGLISSSDHLGPLVEYVLTLEPGQIVIETGEEGG